MHNDIKPINLSIYPWSITIGIVLDLFFVLLFSYRVVSGDLSVFESLILIVGIVFLIHLIVCPFAGKIVVSENKLKINYFFIWNEDFEIEIDRISAISVRSTYKYRTYMKLYLTIDETEMKVLNIQTYNGFLKRESLESNLARIIASNHKEKQPQ